LTSGCIPNAQVDENFSDDDLSKDKKDYSVNKGFSCPSDDGYFPNKFVRSHYFACVGGFPYPMVSYKEKLK
jgi:hypothetical protein